MKSPVEQLRLDEAIGRQVKDLQRVAAVRATELLDTPPEVGFDRLTRMAQRLTGAPAAFLTLVDSDRDFYKSMSGVGEPLATQRQVTGRTFCQYCMAGDSPLVLEDVRYHPGHEFVPAVRGMGLLSYAGVPLLDGEGHHIGSFCVVDFRPHAWSEQDVYVLQELAQSVQRELALHEAVLQARRASRAKSAFLAKMSHEIRTPMNAVLVLAELLERGPLQPRQQEQLAGLQAAGKHLLQVIDDVLDLSKIEAGRVVLASEDFELAALITGVVQIVSAMAQAKGDLEVSWQVDPQAPAWLRGDVTRLRQALINLAGNAVKFTPAGQVRLAVHLDEPRGGQETGRVLLRFEVHDSGIGLSEHQLAGLFQEFQQADESTTGRYGGTGLGLAIVRNLSQLMQGQCGGRSEPGRGSVFWFTAWLDRGRPAVAEPSTKEGEEKVLALHGGKRVLLAEDNPVNQILMRELLEGAGLQVDVAQDGLEAVDMAQRGDYALILMDMQMPHQDGLAAAREIRAHAPKIDVPIVAMTANVFEEDRQLCREAGMDDFIGKPVQTNQLFTVLLRWLA